jgi:hypothetical protein
MTLNHRPWISNGKEMIAAAPLFWIEEFHTGLNKWVRLSNCDYGLQEQAESQANDWNRNESRFLRVVEIRETVTRLFIHPETT